MTHRIRCFFVLLLVCCAPGLCLAQAAESLDAASQARYHALIAELRCVVCQNRSIAESDAPLAGDLRHVVERQIRAGQSNAAIKHYLVDRYGDWILYDPPWQRSTVLLWTGPFLLLAIGALLIAALMRRERSVPSEATIKAGRDDHGDRLGQILADDRANRSEPKQ